MELNETLKKILGEEYTEEMNPEDVLKALGSKHIADLSKGEYVSKSTYTDELRKANAKKDDYKKRLDEKMTDEEKQKAAFEEKERLFEEQAKENRRLKVANVFAKANWPEEEYASLLDQEISEDAAKAIVTVVSARGEADKAKIEELKMKGFAGPDGGNETYAGKKFSDLSLDEKMKLAGEDPQEYERLKNKKE